MMLTRCFDSDPLRLTGAIGAVLFRCLLVHAGGGPPDSHAINSRLAIQTLIAANRSYPELEIDRDTLRQVNRDCRGVKDWKAVQDALDAVLGASEQRLHRKYTFQHLVGAGDLLEALVYAEIAIDVKDQEALLEKLEGRRVDFLDVHFADVRSICAESLQTVIKREELAKALGPLHDFRTASLREPPSTQPYEFNALPLDLIRTSEVSLELKLTADQLKKLNAVAVRWRQQVIPELDGEDDNLLREQEGKLMDELGQILEAAQVQRLRQLMLQRVMSWYQTQAAVRLLHLKPTPAQLGQLRDNEIGLYTEVEAAKHLRGFQMFAPLIEPHVRSSRYRELTNPRFVPHGMDGLPAKMEYEVFSKLLPTKTKAASPRRKR